MAAADELMATGSARYTSISTRRFMPLPDRLALSAAWSPAGWYVARMRAGSTPAPTQGDTVEPANRATVAKER